MTLPISFDNAVIETGRIHDYVVSDYRSHCDDRSQASITRKGAHTRAYLKRSANRRTRRLATRLPMSTDVATWLGSLDADTRAEALELVTTDTEVGSTVVYTTDELPAEDLEDYDDATDAAEFGVLVFGTDLGVEELLDGFSFTIDPVLRGTLRRHTTNVLVEIG
jgi:hypothetical protein